MPYRAYLRGLLQAERFAERQADIEQDERTRLAVQESLAKRALYGEYGRDVQASTVTPPPRKAGE